MQIYWKQLIRATSTQRTESVKNTSIDITGKLPKGLVEIYGDIAAHTSALGIDFLVVGAMARDLVLVHGYGSKIERGTQDIDFGIYLSGRTDGGSRVG